LAIGVHAGIRPAGADQGDPVFCHGHQCVLNFALKGSIRGLTLPAVISAAIVLDTNFEIWHERFGLEFVTWYIGKSAFQKIVHGIGEFTQGILGTAGPAAQNHLPSRFFNNQLPAA
jgi:hypothetical protein